MRVKTLFVVVVMLGWVSLAGAEKVKTNQAAKLFARPGEQSKVLLKVKSGQNMTVLSKDGRWLKVRVQGRTGYVPRSKVDLPDDDEIARNTRRRPFVDGRGTKRGFGGEEGPDDRVGKDATGEGQDEDEDDKPRHKGGDDDGEEKPKRKVGGDAGDEKPKRKSGGDADEKPKHKSGGDDEEASTSDDDKDSGDVEKQDERPIAHVTEKTTVFNDPDKESDEAFVAKPAMLLYPSDKKGKWTFVESEEGDAGWVLSSKLDIDDGGGGGGAHKRELDARARLGFTFISQGMRTAGSTAKVPDNYNIGTSSVSLAIGAGALYPYKKDYVIGGEFTYDYSKAVPGVFYKDPNSTGAGVNIGIALHNVNVRALGGYDLHKKNGMMVFARLGYRYQAFLIDNVSNPTANPAKLPSEVIKAPTLGGGLSIPKLTDKVGLKFSLDAILAGASITQTQGLEDGSSPSAKMVCLGGVFIYRWKKDMDLQGTYDLNYASIDFGPPLATSTRGHMGTDVQRTDMFHTITFGVQKGF